MLPPEPNIEAKDNNQGEGLLIALALWQQKPIHTLPLSQCLFLA
jgi:hypothetical protein